ncbi:flagellar biosynthesis chaperone FliJ [Anaerobacillus alkaliphilus]|uniref:Flagellar FliJ protein n=1 Tax=Anaerobacillus alkaliphilus TaxID=1548597 RepID=A0A4Q0VNN7_9BACI|nr:flagellar export protein FliJ [Anaerobacillus alkaliphilus]RXI98006.1 flagellar biosynthesis chaperone FliJ [Anaerobacillus alkaliphilus]
MSFKFKLQKILEMSEHEKLKAEKEFTQATRQFEEVATKLYELLKKKENYDNDYRTRMEMGISISDIQQSHTILNQLQKQINQLQIYTQKARENMNVKQELLVEKSIELKKYEKMKQIKYDYYLEEVKRQDDILMDEISVQQFMNR